MKSLLRTAALSGLLFWLVTPEPVQAENSLTATLIPTEITVGDPVSVTLTLATDSPLQGPPRFPVWEEHWGDAEILSAGAPSRTESGTWEQRLSLTVFETGFATLPAVTVDVPAPSGTAPVNLEAPLVIEVASVLPLGETEPTALPPEPPRALPVGQAFWWLVGGLTLICVLLGGWVFSAARRIGAALSALALTPAQAFEKAINALRTESRPEALYTGLSLELRRYMGRALGFPAAEGTTTEIRKQLRGLDVPRDLVHTTLDLLSQADQIKFARQEVANSEAVSKLDTATSLVAKIENWLSPPPAAEQNQASAGQSPTALGGTK